MCQSEISIKNLNSDDITCDINGNIYINDIYTFEITNTNKLHLMKLKNLQTINNKTIELRNMVSLLDVDDGLKEFAISKIYNKYIDKTDELKYLESKLLDDNFDYVLDENINNNNDEAYFNFFGKINNSKYIIDFLPLYNVIIIQNKKHVFISQKYNDIVEYNITINLDSHIITLNINNKVVDAINENINII